MKLYDVRPEESIFVGDSIIDIQTAKNANMISAGVLGNGNLNELHSADEIFEKPSDLLSYFLDK